MDQDHFDKETDPIGQGKRRFLFFSVMLFHFAVVVLPLLFVMIQELLNPPAIVTKVSLVDSPPNDFDEPSLDPSDKDPNPSFDPSPPPPIEPIPDLPPEEEPQPTPPEEEVKPVTKKIEDPAPIEEPKKKDPPKKKEKPTTRKPLTMDDILKNSRTVVKTNTQTRTAKPNSSANALKEALRIAQGNTPGATGSQKAGGAGGPKGIPRKEFMDYYKSLHQFLYPRWSQPNAAALGGQRPSVDVLLDIDANGRIRSAKIVEKSGIPAMDESVQNMLSELSTLPPPPRAMQITVTLRVKD